MNSSLYKKSQFKYLCSILGCQTEELSLIIENVDDYYHEWFEQKVDKVTGKDKTYKDGTVKQRAIRPSLKRLKVIQKIIKTKILTPIPLPPHIHGGVKRKSNITNAKPHQGKKFQFTTDLQEFYPTVKHAHVYSLFLKLGYSNYVANWLTRLTTWKYELPQGAPTSTHLSNLVFLEIDQQLIGISERCGLTYTRYVDDLTFSSHEDFRSLTTEILDVIRNAGFKISYRKTKYKGRQNITGIDVFNNYIDAPEKIMVKARLEETQQTGAKPYQNYLASVRRTNNNRRRKTH